jgi:CP family cyanate transporter-like MFS transporter
VTLDSMTPTRRTVSLPLLLAVFVVVGLNLRPAIAAIPPVLDDIENDLGLSSTAAGLLTSIPVLCMGLLAPPAHRLAHRIGAHRVVLLALTLLTIGQAARIASESAVLLYLSTLVSGAGIAGTATVIPSLVRRNLPDRAGLGTATYSVALSLGASAAAVFSAPMADWLGGWANSLATWSVLAAVALVGWVVIAPRLAPEVDAATRSNTTASRLPWGSRTAWLVAGYLAGNALIFYSILTWLAPMYRDLNWSAGRAGALLGLFNLVQAGGMFVFPLVADRFRDRRPLFVIASICVVTGIVAIVAAPTALAWPASVVLALGSGGGFALTLLLLVDYAPSAQDAPRLSAFVFLVSYGVGSLGPIVLGAFRDLTDSSRVGFIALAVIGVAQLALTATFRRDRTL